MKILSHHIYEYKKGLRNLVLHTMEASQMDTAINKLESGNIDYVIHYVDKNKIKVNIFFGKKECVNIIKSFGTFKVSELTAEEDYILGIMLGYDRLAQCERYLKMIKRTKQIRVA
ncbi:MAG: DUF2023 family protein [Spirochaetes bacterium]|nr:DUF2023 family protein [Spirochaetota bacterium]